MKRIYKFFFTAQREDEQFMLFFRTSIGLFCLIHFCSILNDFNLLYSNNGIIPSEISSLFKPVFIPSLENWNNLFQYLFNFDEYISIYFFKVVYLMLCVFIIIGLFTRFSAILLLVLQLMLSRGAPLFAYGVDSFTTIALFYCCLFPVGNYISVDKYFFNLKSINVTPYRRMLQIHLCFVYLFSGIVKIIGFNWWNGESIWKALHLPFFESYLNLNYSFLANYPIIPIVMGWTIIVIEILYPFFIWKVKFRRLWLILTILLHVGILICLNLYFFSTLMIILNLSAFLDLASDRKTTNEDIPIPNPAYA